MFMYSLKTFACSHLPHSVRV